MNREEKKIVIFDFDGVMVNSFDFCHKLASESHTDLTEEKYKTFFDGNIFSSLEKKKNIKQTPKRGDAFFTKYEPELMQCGMVKDIDTVIKHLAEKYTLVINSSTIGSIIEDFLVAHNMRQYFNEVNGPEVTTSKVEKFEAVFKTYNVTAKNCLFITDTLGDLREAEELAIPSIGVTWGYHEKHRLEKGVSKSIVDSPEALLQQVEQHFDH